MIGRDLSLECCIYRYEGRDDYAEGQHIFHCSSTKTLFKCLSRMNRLVYESLCRFHSSSDTRSPQHLPNAILSTPFNISFKAQRKPTTPLSSPINTSSQLTTKVDITTHLQTPLPYHPHPIHNLYPHNLPNPRSSTHNHNQSDP